MDNATIVSGDSSVRAQSRCKLNAEPFSQSKSAESKFCSEMDNIIIKKMSITGETQATLDNDLIDLESKPQISNHNVSKQQPAQEMIYSRDEKHIRPERFVSNSIIPNRPFGDQYGFIPYFIKKAAEHLKLTRERLPSKNDSIVSDIVKQAASGITEEAIKLGKPSEGQSLADKLLEVKDSGMKEVWKCCARLYTESMFLYTSINATMRWIGNEERKSDWENGVKTLGPFCLLLWDNPFNSHMTKPETILYRGAALSKNYVAAFKNSLSKDSGALHSFQAFTSCTRDRNVAEMFVGSGVLFIMRVKLAFTADLKPYSQFPDEEEELLYPGVCFRIDHFGYDDRKKQHLIYLTLHQKHNSKPS